MHANNRIAGARFGRTIVNGIRTAMLPLYVTAIFSSVSGGSLAAGEQTCRPSACHSYVPRSVSHYIAPDTHIIPISLTLPSSAIISGDSTTLSMTVDSVPAGGGYVQILCDTPDALASPGGTWPYQVVYADGSSTAASVTVTASSVTASTTVTMYM